MGINYSVLFICHSGEIEVKSALLALSLKQQADPDMEIIAAVPRTGNQTLYPSKETITFLKELGINMVIFDNPYLSESKNEPGDLFTNKSFCLKKPYKGEYIIFLDSDIICLNNLNLRNIPLSDFAAKQVDFANIPNWDQLYTNFKMVTPVERIECTVDKQLSPPYFNSGVFIIKQEICGKLADIWHNIFSEITSSNLMHNNMLRRHQASLAIAIQKLKFPYKVLSEDYNFPARSMKKMDPDRVIFVHYHDAPTIVRVYSLRKYVDRMIAEFPLLEGIIEQNKIWKRLFVGRFKWIFRVQILLKSIISNVIRFSRKFSL